MTCVKSNDGAAWSNAGMETMSRLLALCGEGLEAAATGAAGLPVAMFLAGLAGSLIHCVGMCGPFVMGQVIADADRPGRGGYGEWQRLAGAALAPYHLGRFTTYAALGAVAGEVTSLFASTTNFRWLSGVLLVGAAVLLILQALGLSFGTGGGTGGGAHQGILSRLAAPLAGATGHGARYGLGVLLGFLPCGLLYGALAAAAGTASAGRGALTMAAFALGTAPALIAVGWGGLLMRRKLNGMGRWLAAPLLAGNALVMLTLASQRF